MKKEINDDNWMKMHEEFYPKAGGFYDIKTNDGSIYDDVYYDEDDNSVFFVTEDGYVNPVDVTEIRKYTSK